MTERVDVAVIGGGPAGATAAADCAKGGAVTALLERVTVGGEVVNQEEVSGLPEIEPVSGPDFAATLTMQLLADGVDLRLGDEATAVSAGANGWRVATALGEVQATVLILCTGSGFVSLPGRPAPEADPLAGAGLFTCAACDGPLYAGRRVAVAGGGDTGAGGALALSRYAGHVVLFEREPQLTAQPELVSALAELDNVEVRLGAEVTSPLGQSRLEGVAVSERHGQTAEPVEGLLLAVGLRARTDLVRELVELDEAGAVKVGSGLSSSAPRLLVAGDAREGAAYRCEGALADGRTAARSALACLGA